MTIEWGAWEDSGGNGMRVGIEVTWEAISHSETQATATVEIWTENRFSYGDTQTLNFGGSLSGSVTFTNNDGGAPVKRATRTYDYNYAASSYGSSPGSRTFTAALSGAYNGVTPAKSVTKAIPARPYGAPAAPTNAAVSRVSDASNKVTWTNRSTAGEPYESQQVQRWVFGVSSSWWTVSNPSGSAASYTDGNAYPNRKHQYRVKAVNDIGSSAYDTTGYIWTSPAMPDNVVRTTVGGDQVLTWDNVVGYDEYVTQIWHAANGIWDASPLVEVLDGIDTWTHVAPAAGVAHSYKLRTRGGLTLNLYSAYTAPTTASTSGTATPPSAPTELVPNTVNMDVVFDPTASTLMAWQHNPTDASAQTWFQLRHRKSGTSDWAYVQPVFPDGTVESYTLPANTYLAGDQVEWQVMTWGAASAGSVWSELAQFAFVADGIVPSPDAIRLPMVLNVTTGQAEAVKGTGWVALPLTSPWVEDQPIPEYRVIGNMLHMRGNVVRPSAGVLTPFTLPEGARPPQDLRLLGRIAGDARAVAVGADGVVTVSSAYVNGDLFSLDSLPPILLD